MATKIKLMRLGKMRAPYYRVVVADARTKRDGRAIETIGKYHPKDDPSFIEIDSERAQYWLGVGAQPTEAVAAILRRTGDWQKFKGESAPPPLLVKEPKADKRATFEAAARDAEGQREATTPKGAGRARKAFDSAAAGTPIAGPTADQLAVDAGEKGMSLAQARADAGDIAVDTGTTEPVPGAADSVAEAQLAEAADLSAAADTSADGGVQPAGDADGGQA